MSECIHPTEKKLTKAPNLTYQQKGGRCFLNTDGGKEAAGAVLSQTQDGTEGVTAYASRLLSSPERNCYVTPKGMLSVVYFVNNYVDIIFGVCYWDRPSHPSEALQLQDPEGQVARWIEHLSFVNVAIQHRPGSKQGNAGAISRKLCWQCNQSDYDTEVTINVFSLEQLIYGYCCDDYMSYCRKEL